MKKYKIIKWSLIIYLAFLSLFGRSQVAVEHNLNTNAIKIQDKRGNLVLNINYDNKCIINYVEILGHAAVEKNAGVFSAVKINSNWYTTGSGIPSPKIIMDGDIIIIDDILFGKED